MIMKFFKPADTWFCKVKNMFSLGRKLKCNFIRNILNYQL